MYIELAEFLRCPEGHDPDPYLVLVPDTMERRRVTRGSVACPTCGREYPIVESVVRFEEADPAPAPADPPNVEAIQALLGIDGPGGYVVLVGSAAAAAAGLATRMPGIHFVAINAPATVESLTVMSHLIHPRVPPLKTSMARGVVVGEEHCTRPWLAEAARLVLRGRRLVALREQVPEVPGTAKLAEGHGMWVGEKR